MFYAQFEMLCKEQSKTIQMVSGDLKIPQSTIASWKSRGLTPNAKTLQKVADYFHVTTEYLLTGDKSKKNPNWPFFKENAEPRTPPTLEEDENAQLEIDRLTAEITKPIQNVMNATARHLEIAEESESFRKIYDEMLNDTGKEKIHRYTEDLIKNPANLKPV